MPGLGHCQTRPSRYDPSAQTHRRARTYWVQVREHLGAATATLQQWMYSHRMLTLASRVDVMNRLGRAMADPTRSRILLELLSGPGYPARLSESLGLTRTNVSNHLTCLRGCGIVVATSEGRQTRYEIADPHLTRAITILVDTVLAYDDGAACANENCAVPLCCGPSASIGDQVEGAL